MASVPARFQFIRHALQGDGPFRPKENTTYDPAHDLYVPPSSTGLVSHPRESVKKFCARNALSVYRNPLLQAASRFVGYLTAKPPLRDTLGNPLFEAMADDIDGKGNHLEVFWSGFAIQAKARGSMLLLVDMPNADPATLGDQLAGRVAPYWTALTPESLKEWQLGDDGRFDFVRFHGHYTQHAERLEVVWHFDRETWDVLDRDGKSLLDGGARPHPLGECPVLVFTEIGDFPCFGPFAEIADLAWDFFNQYNELRNHIQRDQGVSLLTMQVPEGTTDQQKVQAAQTVGVTIGSSNMLVHSGNTPQYVAPDAAPADNYLETMKMVSDWINQAGLNVEMPDQQESGIALQMRFQALNSALSAFAQRMEDLERRAWELSRRWLGMEAMPTVAWRRDFSLADIATELSVLQQMQASGMPQAVIAEQQKRIVSIQFPGLDPDAMGAMMSAIDETGAEIPTSGEAAA